MTEPMLILVNGPPATGKSTLAPILAQRLHIPLFSKDQIKEILFDTLGWGEREWSRKLGAACSELLFSLAEAQLRAGQPCMIESNFHAQAALGHLTRLEQHYSFRLIQILCTADAATLTERYNRRILSSQRHPGHLDVPIQPHEVEALFAEAFPAIPYQCTLIEVDTSRPEALDIEQILSRMS